MASGHVNRTRRPNTWLLRPDCDVKKVLANMEPSTHGTFRPSAPVGISALLRKRTHANLRADPGSGAVSEQSGQADRCPRRNVAVADIQSRRMGLPQGIPAAPARLQESLTRNRYYAGCSHIVIGSNPWLRTLCVELGLQSSRRSIMFPGRTFAKHAVASLLCAVLAV